MPGNVGRYGGVMRGGGFTASFMTPQTFAVARWVFGIVGLVAKL